MKFSRNAGLVVAAASLVSWVVLAAGRGRFWSARTDDHLGPRPAAGALPSVAVVIPARNEADTIGAAVTSLVGQDYAGPLGITLVDDDSDDGTAAVARDAVTNASLRERFEVIRGRPLDPPWTGKLNALDAGIGHVRARRGVPEYWLFTDADIEHDPNNVADLVAKSVRDDLDLVSLMVQLRCESSFERLLVPAFVFFFAKLYPFAWSNDPARTTAAAAGGCVLIRASALERIGGLRSIGDRLIDDCALAAAVKGGGGRTWIGLTSRTVSIREYGTLEPFWTMVKRSAFTQLGRSYGATVGAAAGMVLLYLAPPALFTVGIVRGDRLLAGVAGAAWALMSALYVPMLRAYGLPAWHALRLPVAAALYTTMTLDSARSHASGRGGALEGPVRDITRATFDVGVPNPKLPNCQCECLRLLQRSAFEKTAPFSGIHVRKPNPAKELTACNLSTNSWATSKTAAWPIRAARKSSGPRPLCPCSPRSKSASRRRSRSPASASARACT